jgi:hypothetical protein
LAVNGIPADAMDNPVAPIAEFLINFRRELFILKMFDCQKNMFKNRSLKILLN